MIGLPTGTRPMLEIAGTDGIRWGLHVVNGVVCPLQLKDGQSQWEPMYGIPAKLGEFLDTFMAQSFAVLSRAGFVGLPVPPDSIQVQAQIPEAVAADVRRSGGAGAHRQNVVVERRERRRRAAEAKVATRKKPAAKKR